MNNEQSLFVSICIPAYEYPNLLNRCLLSIINQTYSNFEVIITDDSSHNKLAEVVKGINDDRIQYHKNIEPLGSPKNWNKAVSYAKGDLIKILHHDDWFVDETSLQKFVRPFEININLYFAFSACNNVFPNVTKIHYCSNMYLKKILKQPRTVMLLNGIGAPSTGIFRKSVWKDIKYDEKTKWYVDVLFYVATIEKYKSFFYIREPLVNITAGSPNQVTNTTTGIEKVKEAMYAFEKNNFLNTTLSWFLFIHFIELFSRYKIKSIEDIDVEAKRINSYKQLEKALKYSKLPISYLFYALVRRFCIKNLPFKIRL